METIPQVCAAIMRTVTTAAELAGRESGLVQRSRKLSGDKLAQILIFGWLSHAQATLEQLSQTAAALGYGLAPKPLTSALGRQPPPLWNGCCRPRSRKWCWPRPRLYPSFSTSKGCWCRIVRW